MKKWINYLVVILLCSLTACQESVTINLDYPKAAAQAEFMHRSVKQLTDIIVHDIFSPPVASRNYVYPSVAAYEILRQDHNNFKSLAGQLHQLSEIPAPIKDKEYCYPLAAIHAYTKIGQQLIFSEDKMEAFRENLYKEFKAMNMPEEVYQRSLEYGDQVVAHILAWADKDNYKQTRTFSRYSITDEPGRWNPTPPDYMDGIEPHWNKIRPLVLESAGQFQPAGPTPFSLDKKSQFYQEMMEVYNVVKEAGEEEVAIAKFWDCNPYVSHHVGHVMYATKKITPGGHWMGITKIASQKANLDMMKTVEAYTMVSIALFDAFIACWDEKYRSSLIRPETVINEVVDEDWLPLLQTPPFPEHTSGHSVISTASAVVLTDLLGDNFSFVDSTEVEYGLPPRTFNSFLAASEEAAVSRLYGGIHYRPAIEVGVEQGKQVGAYVLEKVRTKVR